jgi:hypothetical protein
MNIINRLRRRTHPTNTAADRVTRDARRLDNHFGGRQWANRIDLNTLRMNSAEHCVLGQLFGDFIDGLDEIGVADFGGDHAYFGGRYTDGSDLDTEWHKAIASRQ